MAMAVVPAVMPAVITVIPTMIAVLLDDDDRAGVGRRARHNREGNTEGRDGRESEEDLAHAFLLLWKVTDLQRTRIESRSKFCFEPTFSKLKACSCNRLKPERLRRT
jgi:hypothetical protein